MSQLGQLRKKAMRAAGLPVSDREKLTVLVMSLTNIASLTAQREDIKPMDLAEIAVNALNNIGIKLVLKDKVNGQTEQQG